MMSMKTSKASLKIVSVILIYVLCVLAVPAGAQSMDELYKLALKEGGTLNFYGTLAQINAERIIPVFEKRYPGIKVNHVDATADKLAARAITEARGGRVFSDIFQMALENVLQVADQKLLVDWLPPEAAEKSELVGGGHGDHYHRMEYEPGKKRGRAKTIRRLRRSQMERKIDR
ncbi:MAG: extracellular solute-binding protein [Deltaproteobacteria bacterium]|nr:MAG: extracellular solute-binding protein [Deltaproteobacteria bacterium]